MAGQLLLLLRMLGAMVLGTVRNQQPQHMGQVQQQGVAMVQALVGQTPTISREGTVGELGRVVVGLGVTAVLVVVATGAQGEGQQHTRPQHLLPVLCGQPCRMTRAAPTTTTPPTGTASGRSLQTCREEVKEGGWLLAMNSLPCIAAECNLLLFMKSYVEQILCCIVCLTGMPAPCFIV
jgi:hypothetical protein